MTATCPNCSADIPIALVRHKRFECPKCSVRLSGSLGVALLVTVVVWSLVELLVVFAFGILAPGSGFVALVLRSVLSAFIGLGIFAALAPHLARVEFAS